MNVLQERLETLSARCDELDSPSDRTIQRNLTIIRSRIKVALNDLKRHSFSYPEWVVRQTEIDLERIEAPLPNWMMGSAA
jgi:hypothetical protein